MTKETKLSNNSILDSFYKRVMLLLFFILPKKVSSIFVNLSLLSIIYRIRDVRLDELTVNKDKIEHFLKVYINEDVLLLPYYTTYWFWNEEFLSRKIFIENKEMTIYNAVADQKVFIKHFREILDLFLDNLPGILKLKLGLNQEKNRMIIKHNVVHSLLHG